MPEGHTIHRYARLHRRHFAGLPVAVSSPQGRFSEGAARLDGRRLETTEALGKHLFYRWEGGLTLHVHLGLFGKFKTFTTDPPPPTPGTRLAWQAESGTLYLAGPTACELISAPEEQSIRDRIGPDPLDRRADPAEFVRALGRRSAPIGAALLDQKAVAGIGNVYRAELLFLRGIAPHRASRSLSRDEVRALWDVTVNQLRRGEQRGRIVTVDPTELGASRDRDLSRSERLYVYGRVGRPCRRCTTPVVSEEMGGRPISYCPSCQR